MTISCQGKIIDLSTPKVMGVLNITPNSFYDGGKFKNEFDIINQVQKMLSDGATFIDIGAYSSKPNAEFVSELEETNRIIPIVKLLKKEFPNIILSIDTFRSAVAERCIEEGAALINDISAGILDENMMKIIAKYQVPYIMMHLKGTPQTMQSLTNYKNIIKEIIYYFSIQISKALELNINDLIIDPGLGFSKTIDQNFELLRNLEFFKNIKLPILVGISRKSMIYKTLNTTPEYSLNGTTILNTILLTKGISILRVHDVKEAMECITLFEKQKKIVV